VGENGILTHIVCENANFTNHVGENSKGVFADDGFLRCFYTNLKCGTNHFRLTILVTWK